MAHLSARSSARRAGLLAVAAVLPLPLAACGADATAAKRSATAPSQAVELTLPRPTGGQAIGTTELHLVDKRRADPWVAGARRELMISVWYPARRGAPARPAPYLRPGVAKAAEQAKAFDLFEPGSVDWTGARTHAAESAPADTRRGARPVVFYSPGMGVPRALGTTMAEELAGRGYVVVTIDHTHEALVEFPGGRVEGPKLPPSSPETRKKALDARVQDTRFVLDRLTALRNGANPDAEGRRLPKGLSRTLDLSKVGAFGHSAGGIQAAEAIRVDRRFDAGINMDGTLQYADDDLMPVAKEGVRRPFMLMGAASFGEPQNHQTSPSWNAFWRHSTGWKRDLHVPLGAHYSFTDMQTIIPELDKSLDLPAESRQGFIGTVPAERFFASSRAYVGAFFDRHLRGRPEPVLDGPSPEHPDVRFIG